MTRGPGFGTCARPPRPSSSSRPGWTPYRSYAHTPLVYSAVERKFEIIGEALNQLDKAQAELAARIPHLPQIVAFRNQLIHGYARVYHDTVWDVIEHSLPALEAVVNELLQELGQG